MKTEAIHFVAARKVEVREVEVGDPKPHEVQVLCKAGGISAADVALFTEAAKRPYPFIGGHEGVGQVIRVGSEVKNIRPGEYVTCYPWQKLQNVDACRAHKVPGEPEDPALWLVEPVACVVNAIHHARIRPGERVLVLGAGFMGLTITQLLARYPVYELIAADLKPQNLTLATQFGATETVNTSTKDGEARLKTLANEPFDLVVETAGAQQTLDLATQLVRRGGRLCIFSWHHASRQVDVGAWHTKALRVLNANPSLAEDDARAGNFERAVRCMWRGLIDLKPLVTHRHKFAEAQAALELAAKKPDGHIKGALTF
ncbi:MAG: zinc-binding dehydrogenase [Verrucomicrobia bacterium]|nr:zinc-binding dehydrogenase [Verrucomicrobiota bacterium]